jgi:DNA-binding beta-propeller fold protein YncE
MSSEYLFPVRQTRRDFLKLAATGAAALAVPQLASAADRPPVKFGTGAWTYTLDENWGRLPEGMSYGHGCGVVVDSKGRIFVTTRSTKPCVAIFDKEGTLLETWSNDFAAGVGLSAQDVAGTAHGLYLSKEGDQEFLYFTENAGKSAQPGPDGKNAAIGARVFKTDLQGKLLFTLGHVEQEDATHRKFDFSNPTDVAVAPNGDIYAVDGYGSQRVSRFDKNFQPIKSIGGKGTDNEHFNTCHGVWIHTLRGTPEVYVADRSNKRIQIYDLELNYIRTIQGEHVRNPCCFNQGGEHLYIPDLKSVVTIMDKNDQPVAMLGDGQDIPNGGMSAKPEMDLPNIDKFFAPHALAIDKEGSIYVVEWVPWGRVRKLKHTPV